MHNYCKPQSIVTSLLLQVVAFCGYHGIRVEENGNRFVLLKDGYSEPDKPYETFRSHELVEKKNNVTFGEVWIFLCTCIKT